MLVHSFSQTDDWFGDYEDFAAMLGAEARRGKLARARVAGDVPLYLGWATGEKAYLSA